MHPSIQRHAEDANRNAGRIWSAGRRVYSLCAAYNHARRKDATNTPHEHARRLQYVRALINRMSRLGYAEGVNYIVRADGTRWPVKA